MTTTWFISDTHFGHENIIKYTGRPFSSIKEMDEVLIENWNNKVGKNDIVYHLGDFCFGNSFDASTYFGKLSGEIHVLLNPFHHDGQWIKSGLPLASSGSGHWLEYEDSIHVLEFKKYSRNNHSRPIILCHYPIYIWDRKHYLSWHLYGHVHNKEFSIPNSPLSMNVSVDCTKFYPISLEEIANIMLIKEQELDLKDIKGE